MITQKFLFSCDWGTSSFRLWLVNISNGELAGASSTEMGVAVLHQEWLKAAAKQPVEKMDYMLEYLRQQVQKLSGIPDDKNEIMGIVVSGMMSSSIGMMELPYAKIPFQLDGSNIVYHQLDATSYFSYPVLLLSGLHTEKDVMRGEETQMIGLGRAAVKDTALYILPGTHSKHIEVEHGVITGFKTYMTGELFQVLGEHSVLKNSVNTKSLQAGLPASGAAAFKRGIQQSAKGDLLHDLFMVRTGTVLNNIPHEDNTCYLSGLLIGAELRRIDDDRYEQILLACGGKLQPLYEYAFELLKIKVTLIDAGVLDMSTMQAHLKIYQKIIHDGGKKATGT